MRLDKDAIKESLTVEDINLILSELNSDSPHEDRRGNPIYQTVCHGGDSHKLYYYQDSMSFQCYTRCGHISDIYDVVIKAKESHGEIYSFPDAIKYVADKTGKRIVSDKSLGESSDRIDDWEYIDRLTRKKKPTVELSIYNSNVLDVFMDIQHHDWVKEGISPEVMREAEIGYYFKNESISIPHFNINGELVGIRQRNLRKEDLENGRKYMPITCGGTLYRHPTMYNLYNLDKSKNRISELKKVIIYEGEKSCLLNRTYFGEDDFSVAVCGSNISDFQVELLLSLGIEEVIIAFDKEYEDHESKEANIYAKKLLKLARKFTPFVRTFVLWDTEDLLEKQDAPIDKGLDSLLKLMKSKIEITTYEE